MGINPEITSESWGVDSKAWCHSRKGFDTCRSITLDLALFTTANGFGVAPYDDYLPSGTVLGLVTATGLYGPYDANAVNGLETAAGFLFDAVRLTDGKGNAFTKAGTALMREGDVIEAMLPAFTGAATDGELDAAAKVDLANWFWFR